MYIIGAQLHGGATFVGALQQCERTSCHCFGAVVTHRSRQLALSRRGCILAPGKSLFRVHQQPVLNLAPTDRPIVRSPFRHFRSCCLKEFGEALTRIGSGGEESHRWGLALLELHM